MDTLTPTTKLEAVNIILSAIGEAKVQSLESNKQDVSDALSRLDEAQRSVLSRDYWFNSETYDLAPNNDGEYVIPTNALSIRPTLRSSSKFVERGRRLYNTETRTFTGNTEALKVDVLVTMSFEDMPEAARALTFAGAAKHFADRQIGAPTLHQYTTDTERVALRMLNTENLRQRRHNTFNNPSHILNGRRRVF